MHLAQAGRRVLLVEAPACGLSASGRNGGSRAAGSAGETRRLEKDGRADAPRLWGPGRDARRAVKQLIANP